jgi:hypothetical protein
VLSTFSLTLLLADQNAQPYTVWRSPAKVGTKIGAPVQVDTIPGGIITPVLGGNGRAGGELVPAAMLAGIRSPYLFQASGAWDIRPGDDIKAADGTTYEVQHAGIWGGDGLTMAVLSKPEGGIP